MKKEIILCLLFIFISFVLYNSYSFERIYTGYIEGEFVHISAEIPGKLQKLAVSRGEKIYQGQLLFSLEASDEWYAKQQAEAIVQLKEATLSNLIKGKRPDEIEVLIAKREQAKVILDLSEVRLKRNQDLLKSASITQDQFDESRTNYENNKAQLIEAEAELRLANLGAREDEIKAAISDLKEAKSALLQTKWKLSKKTYFASGEAYVQDTLYRPDEWVSSGTPVIVLLPPENLKARFFVSEEDLSKIKIGQSIKLSCDACKELVPAKINYISHDAEYTPPVIFGRDSRQKLVFLVEAKIDPKYVDILHPGQPLDIILEKL